MEKAVLHMDLDTFFVSCERLIDSKLNDRPIMIGGLGSRGVVASCSYEARQFGVHSGMSMKLARRLCPEAVVIRGHTGTYTKYSKLVTDIIQEAVPKFEKASVDEFYIDMSGMDRYFGTHLFSKELRKKIIEETGLPISCGLSINKVVSKVATGEAKPNNEMKVDLGSERNFLAPLSVQKIPQVGKKTYGMLRRMGVEKIRTIQEMPMELMANAFGVNGRMIWKKANGIDNSPVVPFHERKSISTERTFGKDTIDLQYLRGVIIAIAENLSFQLRRGGKLTSCISLKLRYADFHTESRQISIPYSNADHHIIPIAMQLFEQLYQRRLQVRLVGLRCSNLVNGNYQMDLFNASEKMLQLYRAMDRIKERFGERKIIRAVAMNARTVGRFHNPFDGSPPELLAFRHQ